MTFDVSDLPGRAQQLKDAGINAAYQEMTRWGGGSPTMYDEAGKMMAGVENVYNDFLDIPWPETFSGYCQNIASAMALLATEGHTTDPITGASSLGGHNPNLSKVGSSGDLLTDWTGDAADKYKTNYADEFVPTASSQYAALSVLLNAINAEAAVWQTMRDDLDKVSTQAIEYMKKAGNKGGAEWVAVLTIAAAVIAIPFTDGLSGAALPAVAAGLTVTATGIGAASGQVGDNDSMTLDGGSSDHVLSSLDKALKAIKQHAIDGEERIWTAMNQAVGVLDNNWKVFCLPEPAITGAAHHPVNDPSMAGYDA
ncbi:hypothetical protein [Nocardioides montaniterrae]